MSGLMNEKAANVFSVSTRHPVNQLRFHEWYRPGALTFLRVIEPPIPSSNRIMPSSWSVGAYRLGIFPHPKIRCNRVFFIAVPGVAKQLLYYKFAGYGLSQFLMPPNTSYVATHLCFWLHLDFNLLPASPSILLYPPLLLNE